MKKIDSMFTFLGMIGIGLFGYYAGQNACEKRFENDFKEDVEMFSKYRYVELDSGDKISLQKEVDSLQFGKEGGMDYVNIYYTDGEKARFSASENSIVYTVK